VLFAGIAHPKVMTPGSGIPPYVYLPPKPMDGDTLASLAKRVVPKNVTPIVPLVLQSGGATISSEEAGNKTNLTHLLRRAQERYLIVFQCTPDKVERRQR
jgi:hypothetical protein